MVNRERARAQMEGAIIFGMSQAFYGGATMEAGVTEQSNFDTYRLIRTPEAPRAVHIDLLDSEAPPGGIGEPGVPPVAPAIANAITGESVETTRRLIENAKRFHLSARLIAAVPLLRDREELPRAGAPRVMALLPEGTISFGAPSSIRSAAPARTHRSRRPRRRARPADFARCPRAGAAASVTPTATPAHQGRRARPAPHPARARS